MNKILTFTLMSIAVANSLPQQPQLQQQPQQNPEQFDPQLLAYHLQQLQLQQQGLDVQPRQDAQQLFSQQPQQFPATPQAPRPTQPQQQYTAAALQQQQQQLQPQQLRAAIPVRNTLQPQPQQQNLLGVAYSSAADVAKISFNGYGINYSY